MLRWKRLSRLCIPRCRCYPAHTLIFPLVYRHYSTTLGERVSNYITKVINQIPASPHPSTTEITTMIERIPNLTSELTTTVDPVRKLFLVLMQDPVNIDPRIYLHFIQDNVQLLDPQTKRLLIKRLLFHRMYGTAWELLVGEFSSLNDIEEFITVCHTCIKDNSIMLVDLVISMPEYDHKFHDQIMASMAYNFKVERPILEQIYSLWRQGDGDFDSITKSIYTDILYLKVVVRNVDTPANILVNYLQVISIPGWLGSLFEPTPTFLSPNEDKRIRVVAHLLSKKVQFNDADTVHIINSKQVKPYVVYSLYKGTNKYIQNWIMDEVMRTCKYPQFTIVFGEYLSEIPPDLLLRGLTMQRDNSFEDMVSSVNRLIKSNTFDEKMLIELFKTLQMNSTQFHLLLRKLRKRPFLARAVIGQYIRENPPASELTLTTTYVNNKQILLELFRRATLDLELDPGFLAQVYNKLIYVTMTKQHNSNFDTFHNTFVESSYTRRAEFHNTIRALAQTLSLVDEQKVATILSALINFMQTDQFYYRGDTHGINYLIRDIIKEIIRFKQRQDIDLVAFMKSVVKQVNASPKSYLIYWYFKLLVLENPGNAFKLIDSDNSEIGNYFPALVSGILNSASLESNAKVKVLVELINYAHEKGLVQHLNVKTAGELIKLIKSKSITADTIDLVYSLDSKVLRTAIRLQLAKIKR